MNITSLEADQEDLEDSVKRDISAGISVFLVAIPLCLGIAHASGFPLQAGLLSGVIGGLLVGAISGSHTSVTGPAAGLAAVVISGLAALANFKAFLAAVALSGILQIGLSMMRAGSLNRYLPSPVVRGLLTAIGLTLITKQIPHMLGFDFEGFQQEGILRQPGEVPLTNFSYAIRSFQPTALVVGLLSLAVIYVWEKLAHKRFPLIPGSILAVLLGAGLNHILELQGSSLALNGIHLVSVPQISLGALQHPQWQGLMSLKVWEVAIALCLVSSLETLVTIEAIDRLDPQANVTEPNRELMAQGVGNLVCGLLGALPMASVVGRSSVNVTAGASHKRATITQGFLMLLSMMILSPFLDLIPIASLAAILVHVGFELVSQSDVKKVLRRGASRYLPFFTTALGVLVLGVLPGIVAGICCSAFFVLHNLHLGQGLEVEQHGRVTKVIFNEEVTFFHKVSLAAILEKLPDNSILEIDGSRTRSVDYDVIDDLEHFRRSGRHRNIQTIIGGIALLESYTPEQRQAIAAEYDQLLTNNRAWVAEIVKDQPEYFELQSRGQTPSFLFIGCSDSRVPAETITKMDPGKLFVHRNIANLVSHHDINLMSVLQYSVEVLNVPHIIVCGHYGCGGCRAALTNTSLGLIDNWIQPIKQTVKQHQQELDAIADPVQRERRVIELHVIQQVRNLVKTAVVQKSINKLGTPHVHGWVYDLETGFIKDLKANVSIETDFNPVFKFDFDPKASSH
jgi:carbonic anhydrase